jgi:hypothetical protein
MTRGDAPDDVNRLCGTIVLRNQDAWSLRVIRIVLDDNGRRQGSDDVVHKNVVSCEFFIAMQGDPYLAARHEYLSFFQGLAQVRDPSSLEFVLSR